MSKIKLKIDISKTYLFWIFITIVGGRQFNDLVIIEQINLKPYHIFFLVFAIFTLTNFYKINLPNKKLIILYVLLGSISMIRGYFKGYDVLVKYEIIYYSIWAFIAFYSIDDQQKFVRFLKVLIFAWILRVIIMELVFLNHGSSIFFSLDNLRYISGIRQSSDVINTVAFFVFIIAIISLSYKKYILNIYFLYFLLLLSSVVMIRYNIRSTITAFIFILISHYFFIKPSKKSLQYILYPLYIFFTVIILVYLFGYRQINYRSLRNAIYFSNISELNIIKRLAFWYDFIFTSGINIIGIMGKPVLFYLSNDLGLSEYVNPHNSYVFLIFNCGIITTIIFFIILINTLRIGFISLNGDLRYETTIILYCLIGLCAFALTTPIFELSYQGPFYWSFIGLLLKQKKQYTLECV